MPAFAQDAAPEWAEHSYDPAAGETGHKRPDDNSTLPKWPLRSFEKPAEISVVDRVLRIATGDEENPKNGTCAFRMAFDQPATSLTIEIVARVVEQRGDSFAASFLLLGEGNDYAELLLGTKNVLLVGAPGWHVGDFTQPTTFRLVFEQKDGATVTSLYVNDQPKPVQVTHKFKGPVKGMQFGDASKGAATNGITEWDVIRWTPGKVVLPEGATAPPAATGGAIMNVLPSAPVLAGMSVPEAKLSIRKFEESAKSVGFTVDSDRPTELLVRPTAFEIRSGESYSINSSILDPFVVRAESDGLLTLKVPVLQNAAFLIEPATPNLLPDPSFEELGSEASPWQMVGQTGYQPTLDWGHEGTTAKTDAATVVAAPSSSAAAPQARTGGKVLTLVKPADVTAVECRLREPVRVEEGKEYLLEGRYQLHEPQYGSTLHLTAWLEGDGVPPRAINDVFLNPPVYTAPGEWRRSFVRFTVPKGYSRASVRMAVRGVPMGVSWDDLSLRLAPAKVVQFPVQLTPEDTRPRFSPEEVKQHWSGRPAWDVKVANDNGSVSLKVDGQPVPLLAFNAGPYMWPGNGDHRRMADAGVRLQFMPYYVGTTGKQQQYGKPVWLDDGVYDFAPLVERLTQMAGKDLQTKIMFYLHVDPYPHFGDKHPEARWVNMKGEHTIGMKGDFRPAEKRDEPHEQWNFSYTSDQYRRQASHMLEALGKVLASEPVGKAVVGVHLICGADGQWFSMHSPDHYDRSESNVKAFREWLARRYDNDEAAFRKAWAGDASLTFASAKLPEEDERSPDHFFLDRAKPADRRVIDANRFSSEGVSETINLLADSIKRGVDRPFLVTTYYHDIAHGHQMNHLGLQTLLESKSLDGIVSVSDYGLWREIGRTGSMSSLVASLRLHNKIFLTEMDYRTNLAWLPGDAQQYRTAWGVSDDPKEFANQIRRDLGMSLVQGEGGWLYSLGGNPWADDAYMEGVREAIRAAAHVANHPLADDRGQAAIFCDEQMQDYATRKNVYGAGLGMVAYNLFRMTAPRSGVTCDWYLQSDVDHPDRRDYKLNLFLTAATISPQEIDHVQKNLQGGGRTLVFVNASGVSHGEGFESNIKKLTGMTVRCDLSQSIVYRLAPAPAGGKLAEGVANVLSEAAGPLFYVDDPTATPLATIAGTDKVAIAYKKMGDWTSVYVAAPGGISPQLLRTLARDTGLEPVGPLGDATFAGNGMMVLHAITPGTKTLRWTGKSNLIDITTNETVATGAESYEFETDALQTRWFIRVPANKELKQ